MSYQNDDWSGSGYSASAGTSGLHFRIKKDMRSARLRIVSDALRYQDEYDDRTNGDKKILRRVAWIAILREAVGSSISERVVIFHGGPSIYGSIKELVEGDQWGDVKLYDINIVRSGEGLNTKYTVTPCPKPAIGPITAAQQKMVEDANINLRAEIAKIVGDKVWGAVGTQDGEVAQEEHDPFSEN